jgi:outer membrane protein
LNGQEIISPQMAIALALENNYGIKIANNNVELAENNKDVLNSGYLPFLSGNAGATYNEIILRRNFPTEKRQH